MAGKRRDGYETENFRMVEPPDDIICRDCKFKVQPVTVLGITVERYKHMMCDKFDRKPHDIVWDHAMCPYYEKEEE